MQESFCSPFFDPEARNDYPSCHKDAILLIMRGIILLYQPDPNKKRGAHA